LLKKNPLTPGKEVNATIMQRIKFVTCVSL